MRKSRTPLQHYEMLRQKLVAKLSNEEVWKNSVSGKRLRNLCELMEFLAMSEELANLDEEVEETIFEENVKLLLGKSIPLPRILRESMLGFKPVQSFAEKYIKLRDSLRFESKSLANLLREISASAKAEGCTQFSFEEGLANSNDERDSIGYYDTDCSEKPPEYSCEDKENFAAKLRWIRWKIYQKIEHKIATSNDVEKYEKLVHKFVSKFKDTQLSGREVSIWLNKALQTKRDVHEVIFRSNSDASEVHIQVSSQESLGGEYDNEPEVAFVSKFFDKATAYENLCSNLPNVPELEDPDVKLAAAAASKVAEEATAAKAADKATVAKAAEEAAAAKAVEEAAEEAAAAKDCNCDGDKIVTTRMTPGFTSEICGLVSKKRDALRLHKYSRHHVTTSQAGIAKVASNQRCPVATVINTSECCPVPTHDEVKPELEDPDDQIEKRLWRLKERDNDDDFETGYDMFGEHKHEETESKINHLEVKDTKSDKKNADVFDDKTEAMGKIKNPESFNDSVQTKESVPNNINAFDTNKEEFNNWYESQLKIKERKSYVTVPSEEPPGHILSSTLVDDMQYKQLFTTSSESHIQDGEKAPDLMCFLQAYFVLLIATCKTLNETIDKVSHSSFPVIPYQPIQPTPLSARTTSFTPRSMNCACESRGYCVNATTANVGGVVTFSDVTPTATAGVSVFYKWMRLQLQNLKENVILTILSVGVGEQFESIEELKRTRVLRVNQIKI